MSELSPGLAAALEQDRVLLVGAIEMVLPSHTVRLLDGSGQVMIGGHLYSGRDAAWGVVDSVKGITESTGDTAPAITLGMIPASDTALADMLDPALQGSAVTVMLCAVSPITGTVLGDPYVLFLGELDVPTLKGGERDRRVEIKVTSVAERFFALEEGRRLSSSFHQSVWPGELGMDFVTGVEVTIPWGQKAQTSILTRSNSLSYAMTYNRT